MTDPAGRSRSDELRLRILSAAVIGPAALILTWAGGLWFGALVTFSVTVMMVEWTTIVTGTAPRGATLLATALTAGAVLLAALAVTLGWPVPTVVAIALGLIGAAALCGLVAQPGRRIWLVAGPVYAGLPGLALVELRDGTGGLAAIVFLFAVVWTTDIAAFFAGRAIGGPKLWPRVSPKKTWSGAIGGLTGAVIVGALVAHGFGFLAWIAIAVVAAVLSIASQAGDLFESSVKRHFGVKDSGRIIPGHGGILDRVDGLVAAAALAILLGWARGGFADPVAGLLGW
ncbi:phosphatidate cytidylyltransferase [Methyloraptor flagellatus]|uniref:Phosphatidate cytidylyltransferase n=1 Tax=Methyloraptor flagellatus TaxID=3162530 RepID=A0AAU7XEM1_9HYPH